MKLRELESALSGVSSFSTPVPDLEQYPTSPHLAAQLLCTAESSYGDIAGRVVLDLGCGAGMLTVGIALLDAGSVLAVDVDAPALSIAAENVDHFDIADRVDLLHADVLRLNLRRQVDTVVMNPPFGTKRRGVDMAFLQVAIASAGTAVYSLHKSSTREFIDRKVRTWGADPTVVAEMRFAIPSIYAFHQKNSVDVAVDLWRIDTSMRTMGTAFDCAPEDHCAEEASVPVRNGGRVSGAKGRKQTRVQRVRR
jgi:rRNA N6-adenosine-methyltransferase METTL5